MSSARRAAALQTLHKGQPLLLPISIWNAQRQDQPRMPCPRCGHSVVERVALQTGALQTSERPARTCSAPAPGGRGGAAAERMAGGAAGTLARAGVAATAPAAACCPSGGACRSAFCDTVHSPLLSQVAKPVAGLHKSQRCARCSRAHANVSSSPCWNPCTQILEFTDPAADCHIVSPWTLSAPC